MPDLFAIPSNLGQEETSEKLAFLQLVSLLHKKGAETIRYIYEEWQVCRTSYLVYRVSVKCLVQKKKVKEQTREVDIAIFLQMTDNPDEICTRTPVRSSPRFCGILQGDVSFNTLHATG